MIRLALFAPALVSSALFGAPPAKVPPKPPAPPPTVALTIDAPSPTGTWRMKVENTGDIPLRLTADARLLSFDVTAPNAKKAVHCTLPVDMKPSDDINHALVLPPKRSYSETFDPRLYCFGAHEASLVGGAKIVAHLGFAPTPRGAKPSAPFVLSPFEGVEPVVAAAKEILAPPFVLAPTEPVAPAPTNSRPAPAAGDDPFPVTLAITVPRHIDASQSLDLAITVTLANDGARPVTLLFRPETIGFDVLGPEGATHCSWPGMIGGNVREVFTTLAPKAKQSVSVVLAAICPSSAFEHAGLYVVRPRLDTRRMSGASVGLAAYEGEVIGMQPTLLRLHHGRRAPRGVRPSLD